MLTTRYEQQPDLNWEKQEVRHAIYEEAIGFWLDRQVDGFRIDTVNRLSKPSHWPDGKIVDPESRWQPGEQFYINGPRIHEYLIEMRQYMENHRSVKGKDRDLMLVGELPRTKLKNVLNFVHPASKQLSMVLDFDVVKLGAQPLYLNASVHELTTLD